ncbi:MAG: PAS domain-containing protein [Verrucomicrobiota bacterium]
MNLPNFNQIKWRLSLVILGTSFVVLTLGAVAVWVYDTINAKQNLVAQIASLAEVTAANSSVAVAFQDLRDIQDPLNALRSRGEIDAVYIFFRDGKLLASFNRSGPVNFSPPRMLHEGHSFEAYRLVLTRKIRLEDDTVGFIVLHANLKQQTARAKTFLLIVTLFLIGLAGVAMLLASRLQGMVSDPIARLAAVAKQITKHKDYSVRVLSKSPDEIGDLVTAFNQMLTEIETQNRNISESESRLKLALTASSMCVWEWHIASDTVTCSSETKQIFDVTKLPMSLETFYRLIHLDDLESVMNAIQQAVARRVSLAVEYRLRTVNDSILWVAHHGQIRCDANDRPIVLAGIVQNISARKQAEEERHKLTAQLLHAEEEERRRIARELHDTTAQHLAALKMGFTRILNERGADPQSLQPEMLQLLDQAIHEIRTLTYVLHPPLLEEFGLVGALKDFAAGVTRRSGIQVTAGFDGYEGRLSREIELTLFRVVQESISNAVRHSGTKEISIRLARDEQEVRVEIQDFGQGLPITSSKSDTKLPRNSGVGLAAMQERLTMVGGHLTVESDPEGVTVLASVPLLTTNLIPAPISPTVP